MLVLKTKTVIPWKHSFILIADGHYQIYDIGVPLSGINAMEILQLNDLVVCSFIMVNCAEITYVKTVLRRIRDGMKNIAIKADSKAMR